MIFFFSQVPLTSPLIGSTQQLPSFNKQTLGRQEIFRRVDYSTAGNPSNGSISTGNERYFLTQQSGSHAAVAGKGMKSCSSQMSRELPLLDSIPPKRLSASNLYPSDFGLPFQPNQRSSWKFQDLAYGGPYTSLQDPSLYGSYSMLRSKQMLPDEKYPSNNSIHPVHPAHGPVSLGPHDGLSSPPTYVTLASFGANATVTNSFPVYATINKARNDPYQKPNQDLKPPRSLRRSESSSSQRATLLDTNQHSVGSIPGEKAVINLPNVSSFDPALTNTQSHVISSKINSRGTDCKEEVNRKQKANKFEAENVVCNDRKNTITSPLETSDKSGALERISGDGSDEKLLMESAESYKLENAALQRLGALLSTADSDTSSHIFCEKSDSELSNPLVLEQPNRVAPIATGEESLKSTTTTEEDNVSSSNYSEVDKKVISSQLDEAFSTLDEEVQLSNNSGTEI